VCRGRACCRRHKKRKTVSKNYYFLYCNLLATSFYSSCAAAAGQFVHQSPEGRAIINSTIHDAGRMPGHLSGVPWGDSVTVRKSRGVDSLSGRLIRGRGAGAQAHVAAVTWASPALWFYEKTYAP
jgi:hypothetical protein